jgi:hypothetical protein
MSAEWIIYEGQGVPARSSSPTGANTGKFIHELRRIHGRWARPSAASSPGMWVIIQRMHDVRGLDHPREMPGAREFLLPYMGQRREDHPSSSDGRS